LPSRPSQADSSKPTTAPPNISKRLHLAAALLFTTDAITIAIKASRIAGLTDADRSGSGSARRGAVGEVYVADSCEALRRE